MATTTGSASGTTVPDPNLLSLSQLPSSGQAEPASTPAARSAKEEEKEEEAEEEESGETGEESEALTEIKDMVNGLSDDYASIAPKILAAAAKAVKKQASPGFNSKMAQALGRCFAKGRASTIEYARRFAEPLEKVTVEGGSATVYVRDDPWEKSGGDKVKFNWAGQDVEMEMFCDTWLSPEELAAMFSYDGFDPKVFLSGMCSKAKDVDEFRRDTFILTVLFAVRGNSIEKILENSSPLALSIIGPLVVKYGIVSKTGGDKLLVTLSRVGACFPTTIANLLENRQVVPRPYVNGIPRWMQFSGAPALFGSQFPALVEAWKGWAVLFEMTINPKLSKKKVDILMRWQNQLNFARISHASMMKMLPTAKIDEIRLKFGAAPVTDAVLMPWNEMLYVDEAASEAEKQAQLIQAINAAVKGAKQQAQP